jgi:hypothetical protein
MPSKCAPNLSVTLVLARFPTRMIISGAAGSDVVGTLEGCKIPLLAEVAAPVDTIPYSHLGAH